MNGEQCIVRPFHHQMAYDLTRLMLGTLPRENLMILMPPRCAKTDLGVKTFVTWAMSWFPDSEFILTSYTSDLATSNAVSIKQTLEAEWYRDMVDEDWGAEVKMVGEKASGRQDFFHTANGGAVKAVGTGGGITGFGAGKLRKEFGGCILIDDPIKPLDARSPAERQKCIDYYHNTLESRRNRKTAPKTPVVLIMQRVHPDDLAGHLLKHEREKWHVLQLQAHDEDEKVIWPGRLDIQELLEMKEARPDEYWAQYMQIPSQSVRAIFKEKYWQRYSLDMLPKLERSITVKIITGDTAFKAKDSSDWSVFACWGFVRGEGMVLLDVLRGKWEFPELVANAKAFRDKHCKHRPGVCPATKFYIEDKASGTSLVQVMKREGLAVTEWLPTRRADRKKLDAVSPDKVARANECTISLSAGRIIIPEESKKMGPGFKWVDGFVQEHTSFTTDDSHMNDDQVDTTTMGIMIWQEKGGGTGPLPFWVQ